MPTPPFRPAASSANSEWGSRGIVLTIMFRFMLTRQQVLYGLERVELRSTSIFDSCPLKSRDARQDVGNILIKTILKLTMSSFSFILIS